MLNRQVFLKSMFAVVFAAAGAMPAAHAEEPNGTPAEAEAMVHRAVAYIKANGTEKAYAEFTNGTSFKDRNLYVSVYDMNGVDLAHGSNPKLVGKNLMGLKDPNGLEFVRMLTTLAQEKAKGWSQTYQFVNPTTKKIQDKSTYVERLNDTWVAVGVFK